MLNVIVPVDFSETSLNAANYASDMYKYRQDVTLILYHYYSSAEDSAKAHAQLEELKRSFTNSVTNIDIIVESGPNFIQALSTFAHVKRAYIVIMGLTGKTPMAQRFSGTNTLKMTEKDVCPVLIIP